METAINWATLGNIARLRLNSDEEATRTFGRQSAMKRERRSGGNPLEAMAAKL